MSVFGMRGVRGARCAVRGAGRRRCVREQWPRLARRWGRRCTPDCRTYAYTPTRYTTVVQHIKQPNTAVSGMASEEGYPVDLYIYDLSHGLASVLAPAIIGRPVEGVWHTSVVVYGREYFYGANGITSCEPGGTRLREPHEVKRLGPTFVPPALFQEYLHGLSATTYAGAAYRLLEHNCNTFSEEVCVFLCGAHAHVPKHILLQPQALPAPLRLALTALLNSLVPASQDERDPPGPPAP